MLKALMLAFLFIVVGNPAAQETQTGISELDTVIDAIVTRQSRGAAGIGLAQPDPTELLTRLRAIDPETLTFDEQIDRRFAETILVGRILRPTAGQPMGEVAYTRMLQEQHLLPYDAPGLWDYAWQEFDATVQDLEALAFTIDTDKTWLEIAKDVKQDHPDPLKMIEAHQEVVDKARAHLVEQDLMTLPWPETCTVVRRIPTAGNNPYYGNFSGARGRPPGPNGELRGEWHINPFDPAWDTDRRRDYLLEHDWGVIFVTAPHEAYGGHHVQVMYQMNNPRFLRERQGTSMFSEGWGLYNEQLFQETGFFPDERIHLRQLQLRLWRNARVIYDVGMQTGRMSRDQAIRLMVDQVGFLHWAAESEVDAALSRPGYFIGYFLGMSEILKMREEFRQRRGTAFSLKDFHDRLLSVGSMPPALMREALLHGIDNPTSSSQQGFKVHISVDMEGVAGVVDSSHTSPMGRNYAAAREQMVAEANAAIAAAFEAGASEVVVIDSHGDKTNLQPGKLDRRATLISGGPRPLGMMGGIDASFDAAIFIGYHARASTTDATLDHTYTGQLKRVWFNDRELGEAGLNAAVAGQFGVPVVFVSGDRTVTEEVAALVPAVEGVVVKEAIGRTAAHLLHPKESIERIAAGVTVGLGRRSRTQPLIFESPVTLRIEVADSGQADQVMLVPGMKRVGPRLVEYVAIDAVAAYRVSRLVRLLAE